MAERYRPRDVPFPLHDVILRDASDQELARISDTMGLALSVDEMRVIQDYFRRAYAWPASNSTTPASPRSRTHGACTGKMNSRRKTFEDL